MFYYLVAGVAGRERDRLNMEHQDTYRILRPAYGADSDMPVFKGELWL